MLRARGVLVPDGLPAVLGCDGAGVVEAVGERGSRFKPGDPVWFCYGSLGGPEGNYAEYALVDGNIAQPKPSSLDFVHAAAALLVLITAWEALYERADLAEGKRVLIHAGAGGWGMWRSSWRGWPVPECAPRSAVPGKRSWYGRSVPNV